ncbi:MAG: sulfurtransferase [Cyanobacteria bacterium SID2]|nr:sulfurtransferase [Cyanobacteria bacterium SID2]MBP0002843.1 sulfurtransferase [Cyanobacteria bacterium SBC]
MSIEPIPTPLVSANWLTQHLNDPNVVIVDCRFSLAEPELGRQQYLDTHLPDAFYLHLERDLASPVQRHGGRHPLPNPQILAGKLAAIGITSSKTFVVAYDDSRFAFASRCWWLLRYLGHERVAILDGGFSQWQSQGYPVTRELPQPRSGHFTVQLHPDWAIDIAQVKRCRNLPDVALVDARDADRYRGEREPIDPIAGHIPGAINLPWKTMTDDRGFALSPERQRQLWQTLTSADEVVVYCGSGVTACVHILSRQMAKLQPAKLYPGSWSDWCSYQSG